MKEGKFGALALGFALISLLVTFVNIFTVGKVESFVIVPSILAIYFAYATYKEHGDKVLVVFGISVGLLCLIPALGYLFFPEKKSFDYKPNYWGVRFLENSHTIALLYSDSHRDSYVKYTYDVSSRKLTEQPKGKFNHNFKYSRDGKKIVFTDRDDLFMKNVDGNNIQKLTDHNNKNKVSSEKAMDGANIIRVSNVTPSFSPDGKYIIFVRQIFKHKQTEAKSLSEPDCDIFEIDVETGKERQLTSYSVDGRIDRLNYFSDGKRLIFGASGHSKIIDNVNNSFFGIFTLDEEDSQVKPKIISQTCYRPSISFDDRIVCICPTADVVGLGLYDVFIRNGEEFKRITNMKSQVISVEISSDGKLIVFEEYRIKDSSSSNGRHFWVMESDGKNLMEIVPPKE